MSDLVRILSVMSCQVWMDRLRYSAIPCILSWLFWFVPHGRYASHFQNKYLTYVGNHGASQEKEKTKCSHVGQIKMNRLAVYSYLTRYHYEHSGSGRLLTAPLPDSNNARQSYKIAMYRIQDLTSGWIQPESDNNEGHNIIAWRTQELSRLQNYSQFTNDMQWFSANISKITKPTVLQLCRSYCYP